ncbi:MAG: hypothetical protein GYA17_09195 [Chloroflexi bacterium]|nr:hypothetical protein [Anaerolineaceae bacterium]NMB88524.1 hypothetical protein [Chloroflexota bacterium]
MLVIRLVLFAVCQSIIAAIYLLLGELDAWESSIAWWPFTAILTNLVCMFLLGRLYHREGSQWTQLFQFDRSTLGQDLLACLGFAILAFPLASLPNMYLANWLYGSNEAVFSLFFRPLPMWAAPIALVLFPVTIAFGELPTYFGYVMPRLDALSGRRWVGLLLPVLFLALQHVTLPLLFDWRFLVWRAAMFVPFALLVGLALRWRPRLLPYLMIGHALIDLMTIWFVFTASI